MTGKESDIYIALSNPVQTIFGNPPSKSNQYEIIRFKGKCGLRKSDKCKAYERAFALQCSLYRNRHIDKAFDLIITVYVASKAQDIDGTLKIILDCLQGVNAITNDNLCSRIEIKKFVDKINPRIEFIIAY